MIPRLLSRVTACVLAVLAPARAVHAQDTIVIGFGGDLTGPLGASTTQVRNGARMAADEINAAGGIAGKYRIDLRVKDVHSDASEAAAVARDFVAAGAKVMIAPCDLEAAVAFGRPGQQAGVPIIAPCTSASTLASSVGGFIFQLYPSDALQATALARFAREQGYRTAYMLPSEDTPYAAQLPASFAEAFQKMGGASAGKSSITLGQQDFGAAVAAIRSASPAVDVVMTGASEPEFPIFLRQLRDAGVTAPVLAGDAVDSPTTLALGAIAEGLVYVSAACPAPGGALEKFDHGYVAKFGGDPDMDQAPYAAIAYETLKLIEAAITKAGSTDGAAIRDALDAMVEFPGIACGGITLAGAHRVAVRNVALIRVEKGRKTLVKMMRPDAVEAPQ
jgi:branched-chain amino acid transport system substrate-binding protein